MAMMIDDGDGRIVLDFSFMVCIYDVFKPDLFLFVCLALPSQMPC